MASYLTSAATADSKGLHPMDDPTTPQSSPKDVPLSTGLTSDEARRRLEKFGPNAVPDTALHPLRRALTKFWAPVPWMLEAAIVLEIVLGKYVEAAIIAALLAFNAVLGFFQKGRAQATLAALKSRLTLNAAVRRDNVWVTVPALVCAATAPTTRRRCARRKWASPSRPRPTSRKPRPASC